MTEIKTYNADFTCWDDVAREFAAGHYWGSDATEAEKQRLKNLIDIPEPDKILWAGYFQESYEGDALVAYRDKGKYYLVEAGHCSCYGLEGRWEPEEYETKELLLAALRKRSDYDYGANRHNKEIIQAIEADEVSA